MTMKITPAKTTADRKRRQTMLLDFDTYCDLADIKTEISRKENRVITLGEAISHLIKGYRANAA
jgi:hypothetical protein